MNILTPAAVEAQVDTSLMGARRAASMRDSIRPPLSPAKAFLGSLILPGFSQSVLRRPTAMVIFTAVEATGWVMFFRSLNDLNRAKRFARDTVVAEYQYDPTTGVLLRDPTSGDPLVASVEPDPFRDGLVGARKKHVEDWAAIVIFNHLMAGADGLVAAHLWDVEAQLRIQLIPGGGTALMGTIKW